MQVGESSFIEGCRGKPRDFEGHLTDAKNTIERETQAPKRGTAKRLYPTSWSGLGACAKTGPPVTSDSTTVIADLLA